MKLPPRTSRTISASSSIAGAVIGGIGALANVLAMVIIGVVLLIGGIIFHIITYRCPHCGCFLDRSRGEYCPHCGEKLDS